MRGALTSSPRGRAALLLALLLAAVALVATACGSDEPDAAPPGGPGSPASFVPAGAAVYLDVTTDDAGEQWTQATALAARFPAFAGLVADAERELAADDITFDDLREVAGDRAGFAFLRIPDTQGAAAAPTRAEQEDPFMLVIELEPGQEEAALELFRKNEEGLEEPAGEHAGVQYYFNDSDTAVAVKDDALIVTSGESDLFAALDAREEGGASALGGTEQFKQSIAGLPDETAAAAYLDVATLLQALVEDTPELEGLGVTGLGEDAAIGIGAVAEGQGVRLTGVTPNVPSGGSGGFVPTLVDRLPDDAIAYLGFQDPASAVATGFGEAQGDAAEGLKQQVQFFSGQLQAALGVSTEDLAALFGGEAGIAVLPGVEFPGGVIMLKVADPERAARTLEALRTGIPQILGFAGAVQGPARFRQVPLENDVRGWELPIAPGLSVVYGIDGDVVYIGTSTEAIIQLQSPDSKLVDSPRYQASTAGIPGEINGMVYLDMPQVLTALDDAGVLGDLPADVAANVGPLGGVAAWDRPGDPPGFEAFVGIE